METYHPSKREFIKLARKGNLIPVYREILADLETPVSCFMKVGDNPYSYLLESVEGGETLARYSFPLQKSLRLSDAVLAASIFHYRRHTVRQAKRFLQRKGVAVRL